MPLIARIVAARVVPALLPVFRERIERAANRAAADVLAVEVSPGPRQRVVRADLGPRPAVAPVRGQAVIDTPRLRGITDQGQIERTAGSIGDSPGAEVQE